jgi:Na+/H+ antiporter NhaD/arsenite permease-like protein
MKVTIAAHIKKDPVLWISGLLAAATAIIIPPSAEYLSYIDIRTLALLFSLMAVVCALSRKGLLDVTAGFFVRQAHSRRGLTLMLVLLCYVSSMLITNDVALITFVPLALILTKDDKNAMMTTVVLQTVAANLGSMLTPFGNPQNLYLYSAYELSGGDFFTAVLPVGGVSLIAVLALCLLLPQTSLTVHTNKVKAGFKADASVFLLAMLFLLCVAAVLRFVPYPAAAIATVIVLLITDRQALKKVDYNLLITFCFFFVFVGNLGRMEAVKNLLGRLLYGREVLVSAVTSQFVSNVPAALMLSEFTDNGKALVTGTNIGGLGTLIASMASLISFKLYCRAEGAQVKKYFGVFSLVNFGLLAVLLIVVEFVR